MWNMTYSVLSVAAEATGICKSGAKMFLEATPEKHSIVFVQNIFCTGNIADNAKRATVG
jgi:hypothetical protein